LFLNQPFDVTLELALCVCASTRFSKANSSPLALQTTPHGMRMGCTFGSVMVNERVSLGRVARPPESRQPHTRDSTGCLDLGRVLRCRYAAYAQRSVGMDASRRVWGPHRKACCRRDSNDGLKSSVEARPVSPEIVDQCEKDSWVCADRFTAHNTDVVVLSRRSGERSTEDLRFR
jgi:hypothetical protein